MTASVNDSSQNTGPKCYLLFHIYLYEVKSSSKMSVAWAVSSPIRHSHKQHEALVLVGMWGWVLTNHPKLDERWESVELECKVY